MRTKLTALAASCLAVVGSAALAEEGPRTVSDFAGVLTASATRLDAEISARQKAGDMAAAQRLVLAAAMARRAGDEFRLAEQNAMTDDVKGLPAPVPERLAAAVAIASAAAETRAAGDPAFLDEAQRKFNALMEVLPMRPQHAIVYGALSSDLSPSPLPADVVIYGYRLIDPALKLKPVVAFQGGEIASIAVTDDRIDVTLPASVKAETHFAPTPCESRPGFSLRVSASYGEAHGIWPVTWNSEIDTRADVFLLPSPVFYTAKVSTLVDTLVARTSTVPFERKSDLAIADCGQTRAVAFDVPLPEGFKNLACSAAWTETSGAARQDAHCVAEGRDLRVTGEISGGDKVCSPDKLCTCPSGAQGFLVAKGSYQVETAGDPTPVVGQAPALAFAAGSLAQGDLGVAPGGRLRHVGVSLTRRACPTPVDAIDLSIGDDPSGRADATSKTGAFRAVTQGGRLTVGAIDAYPTIVDKTP
jgi:hypothetical protein